MEDVVSGRAQDDAQHIMARNDAPNEVPAPAPSPVLRNLTAAGLVGHEMIGDPDRLGGEAAVLRTLCGLVAGAIYRIEPFHYAFLAREDDLGGALAERASEDWAAALETALQAACGADAVRVRAVDPADAVRAADLDAAGVLLLGAWGAAATEALRAAGPGLQAVVNARFAVDTAMLTARLATERAEALAVASFTRDGAAAATLADLAARLETVEARARLTGSDAAGLDGSAPDAAAEPALDPAGALRLVETLAGLSRRIDAQAEALRAQAGQAARIEAQLHALSRGPGADPGAEMGLVLAEFLARIERRLETVVPDADARPERDGTDRAERDSTARALREARLARREYGARIAREASQARASGEPPLRAMETGAARAFETPRPARVAMPQSL